MSSFIAEVTLVKILLLGILLICISIIMILLKPIKLWEKVIVISFLLFFPIIGSVIYFIHEFIQFMNHRIQIARLLKPKKKSA